MESIVNITMVDDTYHTYLFCNVNIRRLFIISLVKGRDTNNRTVIHVSAKRSSRNKTGPSAIKIF